MHLPITGLTRKLIEANLLTEQQAQSAVELSTRKRLNISKVLVDEGFVSAADLVQLGANSYGLPILDLDAFEPSHLPMQFMNEVLVRKHSALPLFVRGQRLFVAMTDPTNLQALDDIKFHAGLNTEGILVESHKLDQLMDQVLNQVDSSTMAEFDDAELDHLDIQNESQYESMSEPDGDVDDAPIVRFVKKVLVDAVAKGASDIHFEPYEHSYRVRMRIDGILIEYANPPLPLGPRISARIKVMSRLDISERRVPQDGRFKMNLSRTRSMDFRVSTCPTLFGEKVVMRILDPSSAQLGVDQLGYEPFQKEWFLTHIQRPQGMVLVTGPTGSGKTVSLYTAINLLNTVGRNISTAEDPVEIPLPGINQVNVNPKTQLTFSVALRAFLRQDPDVVMVGEVRDLETAEIAIKASQTGHLVLSTLHTNSAPETITRLLNMGIPAYNLATSLNLIIAQRLARRLCEACKRPSPLTQAQLIEFGFNEEDFASDWTLYEPVGCDKCTQGYKGRVGIYELMALNDEISELIMNHGNAIEISKAMSRAGMISLRRAGLLKAMQGITSLAEIERVTKA